MQPCRDGNSKVKLTLFQLIYIDITDINTLENAQLFSLRICIQLYHLIEPHLFDLLCKLNKLFLYEGNIGFKRDMILFV